MRLVRSRPGRLPQPPERMIPVRDRWVSGRGPVL